MFKFLRWNLVGYIEGSVRVANSHATDEVGTATIMLHRRAILFERNPFLWFKTRKLEEAGDCNLIVLNRYSSESLRNYERKKQEWLVGVAVDYRLHTSPVRYSNNVIRLVK